MTALSFFLCRSGLYNAAAETRRMLDVQAMYGTQAPKLAIDGSLALGSLAHGCADAIPRRICGGRVWFMADIRLDHRADLVALLGGHYALVGLGDTDLAALAYETWGNGSFNRLRGQFAICTYDTHSGEITLARDVFGTVPMHVATKGQDVAVATMPKGLNALDFVPGRPDLDFMKIALKTFSMSGDGTFWQGIKRVLPGHFCVIGQDGVVRQTLYWDPVLPRLKLSDRRAYAEALGEKIDRAVASQMRDVDHVATHLSSGLDSSAVTASAARLMAARGGRVTAFTAAPSKGYNTGNPNFVVDETAHAAETADLYPNIDHVVWRPQAKWSVSAIEENFHLTDSHAINMCNLVWIHGINEEARKRGAKVLLTGQFGNFALSQAGEVQACAAIARKDYFDFASVIWELRGAGFATLRRVMGGALRMHGPEPIRRWLTHEKMTPGRSGIGGARDSHQVDEKGGVASVLLAAVKRIDVGLSNKGTLAGWGIATRDPTADRDLVEFALSIPVGMNVQAGKSRAVVREAMCGFMSETARMETRKAIQAADWHEGATAHIGWLREQIDAMRDNDAVYGLIDVERLTALLEDWPTSGWHKPETVLAYRSALLRGVSVGHFIRRASGSNR